MLPFKSVRKALSVTFGDSSPRGRAKGNARNCAICHKKRSVSEPIRSVDCLINAYHCCLIRISFQKESKKVYVFCIESGGIW